MWQGRKLSLRCAGIEILCVLAFVLSLYIRLAPFEPEKASIKTFADFEICREGRGIDLSVSSGPAPNAVPACFVLSPPDSSSMRCVVEKPSAGPESSEGLIRLQRPPPDRSSDDAF